MNPVRRWLALAKVVARNAVPLVGILFYGWSVVNVIVLLRIPAKMTGASA